MAQLDLGPPLVNGETGDADVVQAKFDRITAATPFRDTHLNDMSAAKLTYPTGFTFPSSALPASVLSDVTQASLNNLSTDPQFVMAYGLPFTRRTRPPAYWNAPVGGGFVAPIKDGVLLCSRSNDRVYEIPRNSGGGAPNLYILPQQHSFPSTTRPINAVASSPTAAYVLCQGTSPSINPRLYTIALGVAGGSATLLLDFGSTYTDVRSICINRTGSYLWVTAKRSGDTRFRRLLRVDTSTLAVTEHDVGDNDILGLGVTYTSSAAATATGAVVVPTDNSGGSGNVLRFVQESVTGVYGGAIGAETSVTLDTAIMTVNERLRGACLWRGYIVLVAYDTTLTKVTFTTLTADGARLIGRGLSDNGIETTDLTSAGPSVTTGVSAGTVVIGSVTQDDRLVYAANSGGVVHAYDPRTNTVVEIPVHNASVVAAASGTYDTCGLAFTGRHMIGYFHKASDGTGYLYAF